MAAFGAIFESMASSLLGEVGLKPGHKKFGVRSLILIIS